MKKKSDRGREADQLLRVKTLLDLPTAKRVDVLKAGEYTPSNLLLPILRLVVEM